VPVRRAAVESDANDAGESELRCFPLLPSGRELGTPSRLITFGTSARPRKERVWRAPRVECLAASFHGEVFADLLSIAQGFFRRRYWVRRAAAALQAVLVVQDLVR